PYVISVVDPQRDLVEPAVNGTRSVLEACRKAATVKRVVITSSFAAMTDEPTGRYDEQIWNQTSRLDRNAYYYSKTLAERTAWDFVSNTAGFELISINPALVIGPSIVPSLNESNQVLADLTNGRFPGILSLRWGLVDIRDVAIAHRLAIETDAASGRYLCTAGVWSMRQVVEVARASDLGLGRLASIPLDNVFGDILVKLGATLQSSGARSYLRSHIGRRYEIDTTRIRTELGIEFRSVEASIIEAYWDLRRWGHVTV
ncbi:MAG: NAD-dependent epimerase/dehydratase family protein, partial [Acidimicrobiia bacterium]